MSLDLHLILDDPGDDDMPDEIGDPVSAIDRYTARLVRDGGWRLGTDVENRIAWALSRCGWKARQVRQQHPLLGYRLDFAWPEVGVCLEADGWYHRNLDVIDSDRRRDAALRHAGWWTFRVDWTSDDDEIEIQVGKVSRLVRLMLAESPMWDPKIWSRTDV